MLERQMNLTILTVSPNFSLSMNMNKNIALKIGANFCWVKHVNHCLETKITRLTQNNSSQSEGTFFEYEFATTNITDFYNHAILYNVADMISDNNSKHWFLWVDSDELISLKLIEDICFELPKMKITTNYGISRIWVKKIDNSWCSSQIAVSNNKTVDWQYRLFNPIGVSPDFGVHKNFKFKKKCELITKQSILHLIYEVEGLESRCKKIAGYEEVEPGAGISKIRYYLPELYSNSQAYWNKCSDYEAEYLDSWKNAYDNSASYGNYFSD